MFRRWIHTQRRWITTLQPPSIVARFKIEILISLRVPIVIKNVKLMWRRRLAYSFVVVVKICCLAKVHAVIENDRWGTIAKVGRIQIRTVVVHTRHWQVTGEVITM